MDKLTAGENAELIGDELVPLLNKAGGAGVRRDYRYPDLAGRRGKNRQLGQSGATFNTLLMPRVKDLGTIEMLGSLLPKVEVFTLMSVPGVHGSSDPTPGVDFRSRAELVALP